MYICYASLLCDVIYGELSADTLDKCKYEFTHTYTQPIANVCVYNFHVATLVPNCNNNT